MPPYHLRFLFFLRTYARESTAAVHAPTNACMSAQYALIAPFELETRKADWINRQHELASRAIFADDGLPFAVSGSAVVLVAVDNEYGEDFVVPIRRRVEPQHIEITGLTCVGGLDISCSKVDSDNAVVTLAILSFPQLEVSIFRISAIRVH